jgi:hypothetical protein
MDPDRRQFLTLTILPAILSQEETAWYLGFRRHNITRLVEAGIISPLGHPKPNSIKFFALADLERVRTDPKKLSRAVDSVQSGWKAKNRGRADRRPRGHDDPDANGIS